MVSGVPYLDEKHTYTPIGYCIYCYAADGELTDEHALPNGLGGRHIIPEASCGTCQKTINVFEQYCMRELFGNVRAALGIRSDRKRPANPTSVKLVPQYGGDPFKLYASVDDLPLVPIMPMWPAPFELYGLPAPAKMTARHWVPYLAPSEFLQLHGASGVVSPAINPAFFARQLAKIAHCMAVASVGLDSFEPYLQPLILGEEARYHRLVGTKAEEPSQIDENHSLALVPMFRPHRAAPLLICEMQLFARLGAPIYSIVIGHLTRPWRDNPSDAVGGPPLRSFDTKAYRLPGAWTRAALEARHQYAPSLRKGRAQDHR